MPNYQMPAATTEELRRIEEEIEECWEALHAIYVAQMTALTRVSCDACGTSLDEWDVTVCFGDALCTSLVCETCECPKH